MKEQKLINVYVYHGDTDLTSKVENYLNEGWSIAQISGSVAYGNTPCCFVLLEREKKENKKENLVEKRTNQEIADNVKYVSCDEIYDDMKRENPDMSEDELRHNAADVSRLYNSMQDELKRFILNNEM